MLQANDTATVQKHLAVNIYMLITDLCRLSLPGEICVKIIFSSNAKSQSCLPASWAGALGIPAVLWPDILISPGLDCLVNPELVP